jgi:hypothetical protein
MNQEPPHKRRKQNPASTVYADPDLSSIITSFRNKICPMVLKVKTEAERAIILYDPPSYRDGTTWDDGNIGDSGGCNLTNLPPTRQRNYVKSMVKLIVKAGEIISAGRQHEIGLSSTNFDIYIDRRRVVTVMTTHEQGIEHELSGQITRNGDVVFSNYNNIQISSSIMNAFQQLCILSQFTGVLTIDYGIGVPGHVQEFDVSMCIKRLMSPELRPAHPLAQDIPKEIRPRRTPSPRRVRSLSRFRRIGSRPIPEEIMARIRAEGILRMSRQ